MHRHQGARARRRGVPGPDGVDQEEHQHHRQDGQVQLGPRNHGLRAGVLEPRAHVRRVRPGRLVRIAAIRPFRRLRTSGGGPI